MCPVRNRCERRKFGQHLWFVLGVLVILAKLIISPKNSNERYNFDTNDRPLRENTLLLKL